MPDDRYRTTVEIGVDDHEVRRLGETIHRALEIEPIMRFRRAIEEATAQITRMNAESARAAGIPPAGPTPPGGRGAGGGGRGAGTDRDSRRRGRGLFPGMNDWWRQATATGAGYLGARMLAGGMQRVGAVGPAMMRGQGAISSAIGAVPIFGPYMEAALSGAQGLSQQYGAYGTQLAPMGGMAGIGKLQRGEGSAAEMMQRLGIALPQFAQQIGPLAQALGMRGEGTAETAAQLLGVERTTGIQAGQMAGLVGAAGVAGQAATQKQSAEIITDAISSGLEAGVRQQKLGQYMSEVTSSVTAMRRQGILIEPRSLGAFIAGVSKYGAAFKGEAGVQAAGNILDVMKGAGERNDFGAMLMMKTAMEQGRDPYEAMEALEDPEQAREILPAVIARIRRMGGSESAQAMALHQVMQGRMSRRQAREMISGTEVGAEAFNDTDRQAAIDYIKEQRQVTEKSRGVAAQEAALVNQRIGVGAGVYGQMKKVETAELELAKIAAPVGGEIGEYAAKKLREGIESYKGAKEYFEKVRVPKTPGEAWNAMLKDIGTTLTDIKNIIMNVHDRFFGLREKYLEEKTAGPGLNAPLQTEAGQTE